MCGDGPRFTPAAPVTVLHPPGGMGESQDALNDRPGMRPDTRMVGDSIVLVMPVRGDRITDAPVHLVLRFDPGGEVFAAIGRRRIEPSKP